jgi:hypothetical protein
MARQLPMQDYIFASEIAYKDNPLADLSAFLPGYNFVKGETLGNGLQAFMLQAKSGDGHYLCAFRGTLPDYKGTINHFAAVYNDQITMANNPSPSASQMQQYSADCDAWQGDPLIQDLSADSEIFNGRHVQQFDSAVAFVRNFTSGSQDKSMYVTGHSLGGGIANYVAGILPGITGTTFAAPGYKGYRQASAATMRNYYNVNDTIPTVNLQYHCGQCVAVDILHSSFAVENALGLRKEIMYGFNGIPDATSALTADSSKVMSIVISSLGFLLARLIYHSLPNYAGWVGCKSITGKATKYTLQDFANAAQGFIVKLRWLQRQSVDPTQRLVIFSMRQVKRGEHLMVEVMTAYGNAMIEMEP